MRNFIVAFLMLSVFLQSSWSTAGVFCGDELNPAQRLSLDTHEDATSPTDNEGANPKAPHGHCAFCHLGGALLDQSTSVANGSRALTLPVYEPHAPPDRALAKPERPNWLRAA